MYGMVKFKDWEIQKETKYGKLKYYYKNERIDESELKKYIDKEKIEKVKNLLIDDNENGDVIENNFFDNDNELINIIIPDNIISIEKAAFSGCKNLKEITIPSSVTMIGPATFN